MKIIDNMESSKILISLKKLEDSLNEVESAKAQVQQTVEAYTAVRKEFADYADTLAGIAEYINGIVSEVRAQKAALNKEACKISETIEEKARKMQATHSAALSAALERLKSNLAATNDSFSKACNFTAEVFRKTTDAEISKIKNTVETLKSCVSALSALQENIKETLHGIEIVKQDMGTLKQALMESQGAQDVQLARIKNDIDAFASEQKRTLSTLEVKITSRQDAVAAETNRILTTLSSDLKTTQTAQDSVLSNIVSGMGEHDWRLFHFTQKTEKEHKIVMILLIVNLVLISASAVIQLLR